MRVALERHRIERKDFPVARRGYDREAVDAHLSALAGEIEELQRTTGRGAETLASAVSEQVRAIVAAAETSAAEIQRQAEARAREIKAEASAEANRTREQASTNAHDYVGRVSDSTSGMLERLDAMEGELATMIESLRTGATRLGADLELLERNLIELRGAVAPRLVPQHETAPPAHDQRAAVAEVPAAGVLQEGSGSEDSEGARLIALNMALGGTPREETDRYLAENFRLADRGRLLDDVYASLAG
jgi:DivIVA domain-containing protein